MVALVSGISPVDPIASSSLLCSACRFLLFKPKQTECGHRSCTACLENLFGTHRAQCGFYVLPCTNVAFGCDVVGPTRQMTVHETQECEWQMEHCPRCETFCVHKLLEDHVSTCRKQERCPLCGLADLTEAKLEQHCDPVLGKCPLVKVACPFKEVGCLEQLQRQDMGNYLQAAQHSHLQQLLSLVSSLRTGRAGDGSLPQEQAGSPAGEPPAGDNASSGARGPGPRLSELASRADVLQRTVSGLNEELDRCAQVMEALKHRCLHDEQVTHGLQKKSKGATEGWDNVVQSV